ncbi:MAG: 4Fe-4S dicluster domain-containing protein [Deltaproteobacteria bacterium]|nr:4Fe-4S dicluster domain-containing protein [Deltaproteobacteria bacterium]
MNRREFLTKTVGTGVKTFVFGNLVCTTAELLQDKKSFANSASKKEEPEKVIFGFLVDTRKCIGCGSCVRADKAENGVPEGFFRTWVERYTFFPNGRVLVDSPKGAEDGFWPVKEDKERTLGKPYHHYFVPKLCNHCIDTPCIQVCPVGASFETKEGVILIDQKRCVGCAYCVQACPFGTRYINPEKGVADKCTWCYHRTTQGLKPACVEVCPVKARIFGNISDSESEISKLLRDNRVQVLKSYLGTRPKTRYIGLDSGVI